MLFIKFSKCEFWLESVTFLGHVMSMDGIMVDLSRIRAICNWSRLASLTKFHSFIIDDSLRAFLLFQCL